MTNTVLLRKWIEESGYKLSFIAKTIGLSTYGLQLKIENRNEFKSSEIDGLCRLLGIKNLRDKDRIFFAANSDS